MIDMKGIETRVMINYLHHNGIEVECLRPDQIEDEYGIDCDEFKGDDLNSKRADYDLALAKFLDGFEDGDLIHEKEGFDEVFTKATDINVPRDNDEEFYAYDALFRDRELRYSFANGKWRLWFSGYDPYTGTQILFRVLKANIIESLVIDDEEIMGRELSIRIRGRIAEQIKGDENE